MVNQLSLGADCGRRLRRRYRPVGAVFVECAIVLPVVLLLLLSLLDLGLATLRHNSLGHAARFLAREVALRGSDAIDEGASLGPLTVTGNAGDGSVAAALIRDWLPTIDPAEVTFTVTWPDNDNRARSRVHVELECSHPPIVGGLVPWGTLNLRAESTMRIVN